MRGRMIFQLVFIALFLVFEIYSYYGFKSVVSEKWLKVFKWVYLLQSILVCYAMYAVYVGLHQMDIVRSDRVNLMVGILFTSFITKMVFCSLLILQDGGRFLIGGTQYIQSLFSSNSDTIASIPSRRKFLTSSASLVAAVPFVSLLYGITKGKYRFTVKSLKLAFNDLPNAFNGLKIVQISDIHAGSFDSLDEIQRGVDMINELNPDLVLFTGDLVNSDKDEVNPYIDIFSQIHARYGKYAVLGNHDYYGIRAKRGSDEWNAYFEEFFKKYDAMGFTLLNNTNTELTIDGEAIHLVGVENWGAGRYFQKYGDLDQSVKELPRDSFKILMSHDPTHWDEQVVSHDHKFHLTLSGHTHGMQFGIDIPWIKWSPVKYRYKRWMGLYEDQDQYLYVNRGFGFLGFPGRVGMWPEITQIELVTA